MTGSLLLIMLVLLFLSAFYSGSEAALFSLTRVQRRALRDRRDRASRRVGELLREANRTLAALLVGNNLVNIALSSIATVFFIRLLGSQSRDRAVELSTLVITLAVLLFGETMPKTLAVGSSLRIARLVSGGLIFSMRLLGPLTRLFHWLATLVLRLLAIEEPAAGSGALISRSELHAVFEAVDSEAAVITRNESRLAQNIIDFSRRRAEQIMTPRVDIDDLDGDAPRDQIIRQMRESRHSRYPVYEGNPDRILGFVKAKDYLISPDRELRELIRPVLFRPEAATVDRIFSDMLSTQSAMVIVVDEYGDTAGLITREDVIEEIVGDIYDEFDLEEAPIRERGEGKFILHGRSELADLNDELELDLPVESAVTLNGFLCEVHGRIPRPGTVVEWQRLRFHVLEVARHQVRKVLLEMTDNREDAP